MSKSFGQYPVKRKSIIFFFFTFQDSQIVVRACEGALIIASAPTIDLNCTSVRISLDEYTSYLIEKLIRLCDRIPEDIDPSDIEESNIAWGLIPRDSEYNHFVGRAQLHDFLCWLDYANCVARECIQLTNLGYKFRNDFLLGTIEPVLISIDIPFMLALLSKVIKQINSFVLMEGKNIFFFTYCNMPMAFCFSKTLYCFLCK